MKNYNSWSDFQQSLITLNNKEKGNAFELLTKFYFKINPEGSVALTSLKIINLVLSH